MHIHICIPMLSTKGVIHDYLDNADLFIYFAISISKEALISKATL